MKIEVSNGEIIDKLTILMIKEAQIADQKKLINIRNELNTIKEAAEDMIALNDPLLLELLEINKKLWIIEDDIRECERNRDFGQKFIELARSVYFTNDKRSEIKKKINIQTQSALIEEKSYEAY